MNPKESKNHWPISILGAAAFLAAGAFYVSRSNKSGSKDNFQELSMERKSFIKAIESYLGTPYQWGGGRTPEYDYGVDCSGLVIASYRDSHLPLPRCSMHTSNGWWHCLERISDPLPGDLAFYGHPDQDRAIHVEVVTSWDGQKAETIGANGGGRNTTSPEIASQQNAYVKRESTNIRSLPFLGFTRNPLESLAQEPSMDMEKNQEPLALQPDEVL